MLPACLLLAKAAVNKLLRVILLIRGNGRYRRYAIGLHLGLKIKSPAGPDKSFIPDPQPGSTKRRKARLLHNDYYPALPQKLSQLFSRSPPHKAKPHVAYCYFQSQYVL